MESPWGSHIYWGAYVGMPVETIIAGPLGEAGDGSRKSPVHFARRRGWIMDIYLLKRRGMTVGAHSIIEGRYGGR